MTSFSGEQGMLVYRARVIASGLRLYAKTKMKPNRAYTPTAMLKAASEMTGMTFKRGEYLRAAQELSDLADVIDPQARITGQITP
jgi:hypothetical protein